MGYQVQCAGDDRPWSVCYFSTFVRGLLGRSPLFSGYARGRHRVRRDGRHNDEQRGRRLGQREEVLREGRHEGPLQGQERRREPGPPDEEDLVRRLRRRRYRGRPLQGHVGAGAQHPHQAHEHGVADDRALLKTYDKHWEFYYWGFPPLGLFVILTAALVYTGILTWEDPIGKMLDEGEKKAEAAPSVVSNKEVELVA